MSIAKVLVVDDNKILLLSLTRVLELNDFEVTSANNVAEALHYINTSRFDVLLTDLHMPGPGDGLTVVSAMRHSNPLAVTMLLSSFPEMDAAAQAILLQADEILVKPMNVPALIDAIKQRLTTGPRTTRTVESVATILERTVDQGIEDWYKRVKHDDMLLVVSMSQEERCSHLPQLFRDLIARLRTFRPLGTKDVLSSGPAAHGASRAIPRR